MKSNEWKEYRKNKLIEYFIFVLNSSFGFKMFRVRSLSKETAFLLLAFIRRKLEYTLEFISPSWALISAIFKLSDLKTFDYYIWCDNARLFLDFISYEFWRKKIAQFCAKLIRNGDIILTISLCIAELILYIL